MKSLLRLILFSLCFTAFATLAQDTSLDNVGPAPSPPSDENIPCTDCASDFAVSILRSTASGPGQLRAMVAVSNQGPEAAREVVVQVSPTLPEPMVLAEMSPEPGSTMMENFWIIDELPVNSSAVLIMDFQYTGDMPPAQFELTANIIAARTRIINQGDDRAVLSLDPGDVPDDVTNLASGASNLRLSPEETMLPAGTQWERYRSIKLVASGGTPPLRLRLRGAPEGLGYLGLDGTLTLAGTPREAGEFTIVVTLEDGQEPPASLTREYLLEIAEGTTPPPQDFMPTPTPAAPPAPTQTEPVENQPLEEETPAEGGGDGDSVDPGAAPASSSTGGGNAVPADGSDARTDSLDSGGSDDLADTTGNSPATNTDTAVTSPTDVTGTDAAAPDDDGEAVTDAGGEAVADDGDEVTSGGAVVAGATISFRAPLPEARVGQRFQEQVLLGNTEDAVLAVNQDLLPPGLHIRGEDLVGVPSQSGEFPFTLRGRRLNEQVSRGYTLKVATSPVLIPDQTLPTPAVDTPYRVRLRAVGGTPPYRWSASSLPGGLTLEDTGLLASAGIGSRTERRIGVGVTDAMGRQARTELILPGAVNAPVPRQFSLPTLLRGASYRSALPLHGATPPYRCTLDDGQLPRGLRLDGDCLLLGSPGEAGEFAISVAVSDDSALPLRNTFPLTIRVRDTTGTDSGVPFRLDPTPLTLAVPATSGGDFTTVVVDEFGQRTAVGHTVRDGDADLQLVRYSADGQFLWAERLTLPGDDFAVDAVVSPLDRSLWVVGYSESDNQIRSLVAHFSPLGELLGEILRPHPQQDSALYAVAADGRGIYATGMLRENGQDRGTVLALDVEGAVRWERVAEAGVSVGRAIALLDCTDGDCTSVVAGGQSGEQGWLQRLDAGTGEVDTEVAASVAVPVRDLAVLGDGALALASGVAGLPLLVLDGQFAPRCQAEAARDVALPSITPDAGGFLYLGGQRPSSRRAQLWVYDDRCQRRREVPLDFPDSHFLAASLGVDNRLSLVGERNGDPLAVDLNSGRAF